MTGHDAAAAPADGAPGDRPQPGRLGRLWSRLKAKGVRYWITAFIVLVLATTGSPYIYDYLHLRDARSSFFQKLLEWGPRRAEPKFLRIVLIDNKEYWLGDLAGRRPIIRRYLAELVNKLTARMLKHIGRSVRYGSYIAEQTMKEAGRIIAAGAVRRGEVPQEKLNGKAVIIGADWSRDAFERGPRADEHKTPVGPIVGAMLYANYVEALLDNRIFGAVPGWLLHATEILFGLIAGFIFAIIASPSQKVAGIVALLVILLLVTWLTLHSFGIFFDALVPVLGLGLHSLYERLLAPEHAAQHES